MDNWKKNMIKIKFYVVSVFAVLMFSSCLAEEKNRDIVNSIHMETAILGGGCFWCTEAVFERVNGVKDVISGYAGGKSSNPTYKEICTGKSGHAEVIKITFDPNIISFGRILDIFGECHDPTTLNRQGADVGTQYRSTIMFLSKTQEKLRRNGSINSQISG